ncbi:MAG: HTH domain-containing protein [Erysipelotrichales bacterium]|nr:HTH domain-containing protein [Erysipelotrichales bacterium]
MTVIELMEQLNKSRITILRSIKRLKDFGLIARVGSNKKGYWKIIN